MKILDMQVMKGPNFWSNYRQRLVVMKLDIEELEEYPSHMINGFNARLKKQMPSLYMHRCSYDFEGGFFVRLDEGTWMGHIVEHIALEMQTLAGMDCDFGRTRSCREPGVYKVIFEYCHEEAGRYAARAAVRFAEALVNNNSYNLEADLDELRRIQRRLAFGPSTGAIVAEAEKRRIPYRRVGEDSLVIFGQGKNQQKIRATMTGNTSGIGVDTACDKQETKNLLSAACIPVAEGGTATSVSGLENLVESLGFPLVVKPLNGRHGKGVTTNIKTMEEALRAFETARATSRTVIVERFLEGSDFRFLLINYKLVAVAKRIPAFITGNGTSSVKTLIAQANRHPDRGEGHEKPLTLIDADEITQQILEAHNLDLDSVLAAGEVLHLKYTANLSTGGVSMDVTSRVHPFTVHMAERIARIVGLDICGIDIIAEDITQPLGRNNGGVVEVNASPGFRMHQQPYYGQAVNVAAPVMDMLYPEGKSARIPIVAVTGTNGKTTTTRLVAHMAAYAGHNVGFTTSDGIYIGGERIEAGDCTGYLSAHTVLSDPAVDFAVLECARGGILRSGLGFDHCNISIITNVTEDHLGLKDIHNLADLARVKEVVARSTFDNGYTILNADDDRVYGMMENMSCNVALFSRNCDCERILTHREKGGLVAVEEDGWLTIYDGDERLRLLPLNEIPLSLEGTAGCMIYNIMGAALAGILQRFPLEVLRESLRSFVPSPEMTPGRFNMFEFPDFRVMVDYAHNPGGFERLKEFLDARRCTEKIGVFSATGDRRDQDIQSIGRYAAAMFDLIVVFFDENLRGNTQEHIRAMLEEGIRSVNTGIDVVFIPEQQKAVEFAVSIASKDSFVTLLPYKVEDCIQQVNKLKEDRFDGPQVFFSRRLELPGPGMMAQKPSA